MANKVYKAMMDMRKIMNTASTFITDGAAASTVPALYPLWATGKWAQYRLGTIVRHDDSLWRFSQPALTNEPQNLEPGSVGSESLWEKLLYKAGYRIIPEVITVGLKFSLGEKGWWKDALYESLRDDNVWTPEALPAGWVLVKD